LPFFDFPNAITGNGDTCHGKHSRTVVGWFRGSEFCPLRKSASQDPNQGNSENVGFPGPSALSGPPPRNPNRQEFWPATSCGRRTTFKKRAKCRTGVSPVLPWPKSRSLPFPNYDPWSPKMGIPASSVIPPGLTFAPRH